MVRLSNQILLYVLVYKQILSYIFFWIKGKRKFENVWMGWGTGSPLLGIHFWVNYDWMWSWLDLVGYTQNSVHLPLKMKHIKKQKRNQTTESPKKTRQDSPETQQNQKNKSHKNNLDKFWYVLIILCFPSFFFSVCSGCVFFKPLYSLCCSAQKPGIQKGSKQTPYSNFWLERKRRVKNVWKEGGTGPPLLRIHFLNFWVRYD